MTAAGRRIAVIGGGWAGCAAAVELSRKGALVTLFEAARTLGGRARCVEVNGKKLDNGQHILLGAYSETLRLMRTVDIAPDDVLLRLPLQMRYPAESGGMDFITPRLPAPLHMLVALLRARGLGLDDKLALARFSTSARWMDWQLNADCSVTELLDRFDQTDRLIRLMWRPLCIAALNTPPERASAQVFLNVLKDSLGARRSASDMLIPRVDLTTLLPERAAYFIESHGGTIQYGVNVRKIYRDGARWGIEPGSESFDAIVIATQPTVAAGLLEGLADVTSLNAFNYEPITTCYLQYAPHIKLALPFYALIDDATSGDWGQFVFDRGQLDATQAGLLSVVVSASAEAIGLGHEILAGAVAAQLAKVFQQPGFSNPEWTQVITEKRATYSCTPALARPENATGLTGLAIAGDYTTGGYPATLESAIRSGVQAAGCISG
jgi:squalene-associated FAD-dependent desaturase